MQGDGNFCINKLNDDGTLNAVLWCASTDGGVNRYMTYQTDNNICVYDSDDNAIWCSESDNIIETPGVLYMQNDGNLCAYEGNDITNPTIIWCSDTA